LLIPFPSPARRWGQQGRKEKGYENKRNFSKHVHVPFGVVAKLNQTD
jgi:hypothetical protein